MDQIHFQLNESGLYPKFKPHLLPVQPPTERETRAVFRELRLIILVAREELDDMPSQAKPSQAKILNGGAETCAKRKSWSPCLSAIPAFDRVAILYNRQLNSNRGTCLR